MGKLYIIIALIYAIMKSLNTLEVSPIRVAGEFIKNLFLFPLAAIYDLVKWLSKSEEVKEEVNRRNR